jgi:hypothetical protein
MIIMLYIQTIHQHSHINFILKNYVFKKLKICILNISFKYNSKFLTE